MGRVNGSLIVGDFGRLWMQRESVGILIAVKGVWDFGRL